MPARFGIAPREIDPLPVDEQLSDPPWPSLLVKPDQPGPVTVGQTATMRCALGFAGDHTPVTPSRQPVEWRARRIEPAIEMVQYIQEPLGESVALSVVKIGFSTPPNSTSTSSRLGSRPRQQCLTSVVACWVAVQRRAVGQPDIVDASQRLTRQFETPDQSMDCPAHGADTPQHGTRQQRIIPIFGHRGLPWGPDRGTTSTETRLTELATSDLNGCA